MKLDSYRQIFEKYSYISFYHNPSSGSQVVSCGWTDGETDGQADMTNPTAAFRNFAIAPKK